MSDSLPIIILIMILVICIAAVCILLPMFFFSPWEREKRLKALENARNKDAPHHIEITQEKQALVDSVIEMLKRDIIEFGDYTVLEEILAHVDDEVLKGSLPEEDNGDE